MMARNFACKMCPRRVPARNLLRHIRSCQTQLAHSCREPPGRKYACSVWKIKMRPARPDGTHYEKLYSERILLVQQSRTRTRRAGKRFYSTPPACFEANLYCRNCAAVFIASYYPKVSRPCFIPYAAHPQPRKSGLPL